MIKPEVRFIEVQSETKNSEVNINSLEAQQLMMKYKIDSLNSAPPLYNESPINDPNRELTFDQMVAIEENKAKVIKQQADYIRQQELNRPQTYSFDSRNINYQDTQFRNIDDSGYGIQVQVVSDMPIEEKRRY
jgi:hypothetical protein